MKTNQQHRSYCLPKILGAVCLLLASSCTNHESHYPGPLTVDEALDSFQLHEDFEIEVFASEPHVVDPVEMVFDEEGNIFVMEMSDYPFKSRDIDDNDLVGSVSQYPYHPEVLESGGRIRLLRDTNGDGVIDDSAVFAEGIREGTSILPWDGGLLVTSAPDILFLKDTTGDGSADHREVVFTGFSTANVQAQITSLRYGVDNWIYASNDGRPGEITFLRDPDKPAISIGGADFRFRLDRGEFGRASGVGRVGRTINDWGHRFMTSAVPHVRQAVIPDRYLQRNSYMRSVNTIENINDHGLEMFQLTEAPHWRAHRSAQRQRQYDEAGLDRIEDISGEFTGSTGGTIYTGHIFPKEYYGNLFTGEHAGNLVHRDILQARDDSPVYVASRHPSEMDREFLASTDSWFRPTTFSVGPDGLLYVVDMYRQHTEHPIAIPEELKVNPDLDFTQGLEHGRIYRIMPSDYLESDTQVEQKVNLRKRSPAELVEFLAHPNQWWRLNAQRLLIELQDNTVNSLLIQKLKNDVDARARLHALYTLEGLNSITAQHVRIAMGDDHPSVRENGVILAEKFPELLPTILDLTRDPSVRVAFQATLSAGMFQGEEIAKTFKDVLEKHGEDRWFRTAVLSSTTGSSIGLLEMLIETEFFDNDVPEWKSNFISESTFSIGSRFDSDEINSLLNLITHQLKEDDVSRELIFRGFMAGLNNISEEDLHIHQILQEYEELDESDPSYILNSIRDIVSVSL